MTTSPSTFTDDTGGSVATTGTGQFTVDDGDTYNQGNGTTAGNAILLAGPPTAVIALHYTGTGVSTILAEGGAGTLDGSIVAGQVLSIDGTCSNNAIETVDQNETNAGSVHLTRPDAATRPRLAIGAGAHLHQPIRRHRRTPTPARHGGRTITGNFTNEGNVNVNASGSYNTGTWDNAGALNLADGETLDCQHLASHLHRTTPAVRW